MRTDLGRRLAAVLAALVVGVLSGCSATPGSSRSVGSAAQSSARAVPSAKTTTTTVAPTTTVPPTTTTEPPAAGWTPVSYAGPHIAVDEQTYVAADGAHVTIARFRAGITRFNLHDGSSDPPAGSAQLPADAGPTVSSAETPALVAAFNGGFLTSTGAGGFEADGQVLVPLQPQVASFAIDANGSGHIGVWGDGFPVPGEQVLSVRQNLAPLVEDSQPSPDISSISAWGATLGGGDSVARSALGEDAQGNILYAGSAYALPADMANALISSGATIAMELDINPEWVQIALAPGPGAPLQTGIPGQSRPADQYLVGWTRDFVTVLAG